MGKTQKIDASGTEVNYDKDGLIKVPEGYRILNSYDKITKTSLVAILPQYLKKREFDTWIRFYDGIIGKEVGDNEERHDTTLAIDLVNS